MRREEGRRKDERREGREPRETDSVHVLQCLCANFRREEFVKSRNSYKHIHVRTCGYNVHVHVCIIYML